jgi:hypothetical protein
MRNIESSDAKEVKADIARSNRRRGKRVQKRIAKEMNAKNVGIFGGEDAEHPKFSIK